MTFDQFNLVDESKQAEMLWEAGVHVAERYDAKHYIALYQIHGFYVEVFYHREHNVLMKLRSFLSTDHLHPYINFDLNSLGNKVG
jgi:hypothetical protein